MGNIGLIKCGRDEKCQSHGRLSQSRVCSSLRPGRNESKRGWLGANAARASWSKKSDVCIGCFRTASYLSAGSSRLEQVGFGSRWR